MAKLKAPLLSLGASGSIAKTLTYFTWKGLNVVREHVVPSNPNTALQQTQRAYLTTMVDAIHAAQAHGTPLVQVDQVAYSALASTLAKVMTWFNMACKLGLDALRAGDGRAVYRAGQMSDTDKDDFRPWIGFTDDGVLMVTAGKFYLGSTKTALITASGAAVIVANTSAALAALAGFSGLTAGSKYYWQFRPDAADPCEGSDSGIYYGYAT